jgi:hypothetical protein
MTTKWPTSYSKPAFYCQGLHINNFYSKLCPTDAKHTVALLSKTLCLKRING